MLQVGCRVPLEEKVLCPCSVIMVGINWKAIFFSYRWWQAESQTLCACLRWGACASSSNSWLLGPAGLCSLPHSDGRRAGLVSPTRSYNSFLNKHGATGTKGSPLEVVTSLLLLKPWGFLKQGNKRDWWMKGWGQRALVWCAGSLGGGCCWLFNPQTSTHKLPLLVITPFLEAAVLACRMWMPLFSESGKIYSLWIITSYTWTSIITVGYYAFVWYCEALCKTYSLEINIFLVETLTNSTKGTVWYHLIYVHNLQAGGEERKPPEKNVKQGLQGTEFSS